MTDLHSPKYNWDNCVGMDLLRRLASLQHGVVERADSISRTSQLQKCCNSYCFSLASTLAYYILVVLFTYVLL